MHRELDVAVQRRREVGCARRAQAREGLDVGLPRLRHPSGEQVARALDVELHHGDRRRQRRERPERRLCAQEGVVAGDAGRRDHVRDRLDQHGDRIPWRETALRTGRGLVARLGRGERALQAFARGHAFVEQRVVREAAARVEVRNELADQLGLQLAADDAVHDQHLPQHGHVHAAPAELQCRRPGRLERVVPAAGQGADLVGQVRGMLAHLADEALPVREQQVDRRPGIAGGKQVCGGVELGSGPADEQLGDPRVQRRLALRVDVAEQQRRPPPLVERVAALDDVQHLGGDQRVGARQHQRNVGLAAQVTALLERHRRQAAERDRLRQPARVRVEAHQPRAQRARHVVGQRRARDRAR
jgi:hypothetical protein